MKNKEWKALGFNVAHFDENGYVHEIEQRGERLCWKRVFPNGSSIVVHRAFFDMLEEADEQFQLPEIDGPYSIMLFTDLSPAPFASTEIRGEEFHDVPEDLLKVVLMALGLWLERLSDDDLKWLSTGED